MNKKIEKFMKDHETEIVFGPIIQTEPLTRALSFISRRENTPSNERESPPINCKANEANTD